MASSYPANIRPTSHKKRKPTQSFCQCLAQSLDRFDAHSHLWLDDWYNSHLPALLKLPPELRQSILFECIDDDDIYAPRPSVATRDLSLICKTIAVDVRATKALWDAREKELRRKYGPQQEAFSRYIDDLIKPIKSSAAVLSLATSVARLKERRKRKEKRKIALRNRGGRFTKTRLEMDDCLTGGEEEMKAKHIEKKKRRAKKRRASGRRRG